MTKNAKCPFCGEDCYFQVPSNFANLYLFECQNVCGLFYLEYGAHKYLEENKDVRSLRLNSIRENILANEQDLIPYWSLKQRTDGLQELKGLSPKCIPKCFDDVAAIPIPHSRKMTDLLLLLAESLMGFPPFSTVQLTKKDYSKFRIENRRELFEWMSVLRHSDYVASMEAKATEKVMQRDSIIENSDFSYSITPLGWQEVERLHASVNSGKVFIAMKFSGNPERPEIQQTIERACKETGWEATTIDREEFLGGISDEIIAKINQSKFVIAEFSGQNHGVYYEAGYAAGKGLPVIYVVKEQDCKDLHFDTRHLNHIVWSSYDDLFEKVKNRIEAVINK